MHLIELDKKKTGYNKDGKIYHVGSVEIDGGPFHLILDGTTIGKFGRIAIIPITINNTSLSFPLVTFLPHLEDALNG